MRYGENKIENNKSIEYNTRVAPTIMQQFGGDEMNLLTSFIVGVAIDVAAGIILYYVYKKLDNK